MPKLMGPLHGYWSKAKWNFQAAQLDKVARPRNCHGALRLTVERFAAGQARKKATGTKKTPDAEAPAFLLPLRRALERAGVAAGRANAIIDGELLMG